MFSWGHSPSWGPPSQLYPNLLHLGGNDGIGEEGSCKLVQALNVNRCITLFRLILPKRCKEYATQCQLCPKASIYSDVLHTVRVMKHNKVVGRGDKRLETITKGLAGNQSLPLERLELDWEYTCTDTDSDDLAQFIFTSTNMQYLWICRCTITVMDNSSLQEKSLEYLHCVVNGDDEAKDLAQYWIPTSSGWVYT